MIDYSTLAIIVLSISTLVLAILWQKTQGQKGRYGQEIGRLNTQYASIIDVDQAIGQRENELTSIQGDIDRLRADYASKRTIYDELLKETSVLENRLENISYGLYEPIYKYTSSAEYKVKLEGLRNTVKQLIRDEKAVHCAVEWNVGGSRVEGRKMTKQTAKLMLRAFNGECDSAIARVSWNNMSSMQARIDKSFEAINKLGSVNQMWITNEYYKLRIAELRLEFELQEKLQIEREEQRLIREQMREEEKAHREIEVAQKRAEEEELRYQKALAKAVEEAKKATGEKLASLDLKIKELEDLLSAAQLQKERALSMAQQTRSGHVYVISNIGSFGEDVFKIGMTRRLEPMDRVRELGDASVPFCFDVHALVYSDNAPELEYKIHRRLADKRINLINNRREFFRVDLEEVEGVFAESGHSLTLTKLAEAKEYRETVAIRESQNRVEYAENHLVADPLPLTLD